MDPLTHCLVGGLVAKTLKSHPRRFWILTFLGEAPDLDVFFGGLGSWAFWLQHRGITHSFFGVGIQAFLFTVLFSKWDHGYFHRRLTVYSIPLFLHMLCDWLTSYGTPLLSPFDFREFSGDLVPAVTVVPLVFLGIGLFWLHRKKAQGWRATHYLWGAWGLYLIFSLSSRSLARGLVAPTEVRATLVAGLMNPFRWTAVEESKPCCSYEAYSIDILKRTSTPLIRLGTPLDDFAVQSSLKSPIAKTFMETTRWPVARVFALTDGGWSVEWGKVIFSSRGIVRSKLLVRVAADGTVLEQKKVFGFWSPHEKVTDIPRKWESIQ